MKWATREQRDEAMTALVALSTYRSPTGDEDDTFARLNAAAARTQQPLHWLQRAGLYQAIPSPEPARAWAAVLTAGLLVVLALEVVKAVLR